jgi:hypothetical protein
MYITSLKSQAAQPQLSWGFHSNFWGPFSGELWLGVLASLMLVAISYVVAENLACVRRAKLSAHKSPRSQRAPLGADDEVRVQDIQQRAVPQSTGGM